MNEHLSTVPDYQAAIYQTLLRIERLLTPSVLTPSSASSQTKPTMAMNEAARYLGIGRSKLYELVRTKEIPSIRIGRRILIPTRALEEYLRSYAVKERS
jgi:excisionase family DNA binding protein